MRVFDGTQPQNEHSPPTRRSSTIATERPPSAARPAAFSPGGPAPITTTSKVSAMLPPPFPCSASATPTIRGAPRAATARGASPLRPPLPRERYGLLQDALV